MVPVFCWPMSPPEISTHRPVTSSWSCSGVWRASTTPRRSWLRIARKPRRSPMSWCGCKTEKSRKFDGAEMARLLLFYRLIVRPLLAEPVRTALTVLAIALGVAVVLAIDLAGTSDLEVIASGGVPEGAAGTLSTLPYPVRISARIEDYAIDVDTQHSFPLLGLDLIAKGVGHEDAASSFHMERPEDALKYLGEYESIWVGKSLGHKAGDRIKLLINDQVREYTVRGVYPDANGNAAAIVMDLAAAQVALNRFGRVDRILVKVPPAAGFFGEGEPC